MPFDDSTSQQQKLHQLCKVLESLDSNELMLFLEDLLTPAELRAACDRWEVAKLLDEGIQYRTINDLTGVSTATVTRVARFFSRNKGYRIALNQLSRSLKSETRKPRSRNDSHSEIRKVDGEMS